MKKVGVLLSGSGVYDGSEIHESVFALLAIAEAGADVVCMAPNVNQHHVINHLTGEEMDETRNVLVESARIARGEVIDVDNVNVSDLDALVIPGGFGTAKNHTKWAFSGPEGEINQAVAQLIRNAIEKQVPIAALCMGPTTVAKALEGTSHSAQLSVGTTQEASPYDIAAISAGINKTGSNAVEKSIKEVLVDTNLKIVSAPCYMMNASILEVRENIKQAIDELFKLV